MAYCLRGVLPTLTYDSIGNRLWSAANAATNSYAANCLNQYTTISNLCASVPPRELFYDLDGNLLTNGVFSYAYDAANRLMSVSSNNTLVATFAYDAQGRRVRKIVSHGGTETRRVDYTYDGWMLIRETLTTTDYPLATIDYYSMNFSERCL